MPVTQSAKKALRQSIRRHKRNLLRRHVIKTSWKQALKSPAPETLALAYKALDKAAKTGVIKKNTAARKKSRLVKALRRASGK